MSWQNQLKGDPLPWLLEKEEPGARYLTLRDLLDKPEDDPEMSEAKKAAHEKGPIAAVLKQMHPSGYWEEQGPGYNPKYRSTVWSLILLAQLGARVEMDKRIEIAMKYLLDKALTPLGQISASGTASGTVDCLQGNMCAALLDLGAEEAAVRAQLKALDLPGWTLTVAPARRRGKAVGGGDHPSHRPRREPATRR
jgi:hypothetical protein